MIPHASRALRLGVLLPLAACSFDAPKGSTDPGTAAAGSIEGSSGTRRSGDGGAGGAREAARPGEDGLDEAGGAGGGVGVTRVNTLDAQRFSRGGMISPSVSEGAVRLE